MHGYLYKQGACGMAEKEGCVEMAAGKGGVFGR
jgi:hypothetical protein